MPDRMAFVTFAYHITPDEFLNVEVFDTMLEARVLTKQKPMILLGRIAHLNTSRLLYRPYKIVLKVLTLFADKILWVG